MVGLAILNILSILFLLIVFLFFIIFYLGTLFINILKLLSLNYINNLDLKKDFYIYYNLFTKNIKFLIIILLKVILLAFKVLVK